MRCDLKLTLSYTYINLRREERKGETHGLREDERYDQRGEGETGRGGGGGVGGGVGWEGGREASKQDPTQSYEKKEKQQMGHRYKENGKEEVGKEGRNKKKRLVMSMSSVTSFVDSHRVAMTTVKIPLGEQNKTPELHIF